MNKNLLMLEYDKILNLLADETLSEGSKKKILSLRPVYDNLERCAGLLKETDEAYVLSSKFGSPHFGNIIDITEIVKKSTFEYILSAKELLLILYILKIIDSIKEYQNQFSGLKTYLDGYFNRVISNQYLRSKIESAILSPDEISDDASENLCEIRRKIKITSAKSREKLENIIKSPKYQKYLQSPVVTIRDSRFVLPVKLEYKSEIQGIVHDISASGSTLFIEPMFLVEDNNNLGALRVKEKYEIERILRDLSQEVSNFSENIISSYNALIDLDVIFSKANLGYKFKCCVPKLNLEGRINLKNARHPLISKEKVVPVSVELGIKFDALIITGSNTGGKTAALKTIGLLCAMAASGLMIPAEDGSEICIFGNILVDIGDEQSLEQSLSTFSSHIKNIIYILKNATNKTLVLLDEIGAGTDPIEGAALAKTVIEEIQNKGSKIVVTTHYKELKEYAINSSKVENACCEFDISNLKPTYRLITGIPGNSYAFLIAEKLGIDSHIISKAKKLISKNDASLEETLRKMELARISLENELKFAREEKEKYERLENKFKEKLELFERKKEKDTQKYTYEAKLLLDKVRSQTESLMQEMKLLRKSNLEVSPEKRKEIYSKLRKIEDEVDPVKELTLDKENYDFKLGDNVLILGINKKGKIIGIEGGNKLLVQTENMKLKLPREDLKLLKDCHKIDEHKNKGNITHKVKSIGDVNSINEIDLRGKNALEALNELENFIDNSILFKVNKVTIIHGKGTGVLRKEISKYLSNNRNISSFRLGDFGEGGSGVTVAEIKV